MIFPQPRVRTQLTSSFWVNSIWLKPLQVRPPAAHCDSVFCEPEIIEIDASAAATIMIDVIYRLAVSDRH